jgi:hypothetical protein
VLAMVTIGFTVLPGLAQPVFSSSYVLFGSYAAVSHLLRATIFFLAPRLVEMPSNNSLERSRER